MVMWGKDSTCGGESKRESGHKGSRVFHKLS